MDSCTYKSLFHLDCPGCGLTRAFEALLNGDLVASVQFHPSLIPLLLTLLFMVAYLVSKKMLLQKLMLIALGVGVVGSAIKLLLNFF